MTLTCGSVRTFGSFAQVDPPLSQREGIEGWVADEVGAATAVLPSYRSPPTLGRSLERKGRNYPAFFAAIQSSIFFSRMTIGSAPVISTSAWNSRMSNLSPSAALALSRSRWMVSAPTL